MTTQIVAPDAKRDAAAAVLAATAYAWPTVTLKQPFGAFPIGSRFYGVPSSKDGVHYLANDQACQCPDYQKNGMVCKHVRAVRLADVTHDDLADECAIEQHLVDLVSCRRCGDRVQRPGYCQPCRHRLLGYDDLTD
jgi:hypothetical protein